MLLFLFVLISFSSLMLYSLSLFFFFFSSRRRHTRLQGDWSSDVCSSDLLHVGLVVEQGLRVGVHGDELDALESLVDHAVQGVAAAAPHADDFHPGVLRYRLFELEDHGSLG